MNLNLIDWHCHSQNWHLPLLRLPSAVDRQQKWQCVCTSTDVLSACRHWPHGKSWIVTRAKEAQLSQVSHSGHSSVSNHKLTETHHLPSRAPLYLPSFDAVEWRAFALLAFNNKAHTFGCGVGSMLPGNFAAQSWEFKRCFLAGEKKRANGRLVWVDRAWPLRCFLTFFRFFA